MSYVIKKGELYWSGWSWLSSQPHARRYNDRANLRADPGKRIIKLVPRTPTSEAALRLENAKQATKHAFDMGQLRTELQGAQALVEQLRSNGVAEKIETLFWRNGSLRTQDAMKHADERTKRMRDTLIDLQNRISEALT